MAITPEERLARRNFVGSSDAPAIAGVDPDSTPVAVFLEKVYDVSDLPNRGPIARGNRYEAVLLDWAEEQLGLEIERNVSVRHPTDLIHAANLDGRIKGKRIGVEAKVTGLADQFGSPGTDQIPEKVIVQAHHQMYVADMEIVYVPVLLARMGRPVEEMFEVHRNEDLISAIVSENHTFWESYVIPKLPPPLGGSPSLDVIKRIRRLDGEKVAVPADLVAAWEEARSGRLVAERFEAGALEALLLALGDAEVGDYGDQLKLFTYREQDRKGYSVSPAMYRVPRISKRY